ncbi:MAG: hypothetical protein LBU73_06390 [Helicobacteraceae bacterium]|jgi:hypothetical protein|nr:hypothetical protein [Helicobacteraceae bacterium]
MENNNDLIKELNNMKSLLIELEKSLISMGEEGDKLLDILSSDSRSLISDTENFQKKVANILKEIENGN